MPSKAHTTGPPRFGAGAEASIQHKLRALGGREIGAEEDWRADERYGVSVKGRRFVFRDPAAFHRFEEFVRTDLTGDGALRPD